MKWRYPLSDVDLGKAEEQEVLKVLRSGWLSTGPVTDRLEKAFSEYLGGGVAVAVSNGTAALHLALAALGLGAGDEVILPSFTFVATANAVLYTGATPVFADIKGMNDLNISPEEIEKKITSKTKAILVMHYGGFPCDMRTIMGIARRHGLQVVEDAAHAPGAVYQNKKGGQNKKCGLIGGIGCFSFFSNKNMVAGEGGMVVTRSREWAEEIKRMRSHGMGALSWDKYKGHLSSYDIEKIGYNYRITEIQSALGLVQLRKLDRNNKKRKRLVEAYRKEFQEANGIYVPFQQFNGNPSYHLFSILVEARHRDKLMAGLKEYGIQSSIHYPPLHLFSLYRKRFGLKKGMLPKTEEASQREVTLPLHPRMGIKDMKWIAEKVKKIIKTLDE
jgi:dTDP-4-amino-4,6-dideoxygalactose transaminase